MSRFFEQLTPELTEFIQQQHLFFTASATGEGRINLSPKGMDTFRVFAADRVGYLDLTGSGNETSAHIHADGRLTIMFCSFSSKPLILRLYGLGEVVRPRDAAWETLVPHFEFIPGVRQVIVMNIKSVQTSCGFGVPVYELKSKRPLLADWASKKGPEGIERYWQDKNQISIDGLPTNLLS